MRGGPCNIGVSKPYLNLNSDLLHISGPTAAYTPGLWRVNFAASGSLWARRLAPWPRAARFARCCAWWTAVWCHHRQRREAGAPPTNLSTSCVLRGGVSEMPALGAVLTANCHESYRNVHDRSPRAMLHSSGGACASSRRGNYHKEEREPLEKASIHVEYEAECRRQAIRFAIRFRQHCAVASAARVTPPAPLHTSSERMVTHSPGPLAGQRSEIPR